MFFIKGTIYQTQTNGRVIQTPVSFVAVYDVVDVDLMRHYKIKFYNEISGYNAQVGDILTFSNQSAGNYSSTGAIDTNTWALVLDTVNDDGSLIFTDIWHSQTSQFGMAGTTTWKNVWQSVYNEFFKQSAFLSNYTPSITLALPNLVSLFTEFQNKTPAEWFAWYINRIGNQCYITQNKAAIIIYPRTSIVMGLIGDDYITQIEEQSRSKANTGYNLVRGYNADGSIYKLAWLNGNNNIVTGTSIPASHNSIRATGVTVVDSQNSKDDTLKANAYQVLTQRLNSDYSNICVKLDFSAAPSFAGLGVVYVGDLIHVADGLYLPIREVDFLNSTIIAGTNNDLTLID